MHLFGHSLGGGVAALMCYTLRNSPSLQDRLGATAGRVFATTFGCPPVMTLELSLACADFVTSVVYANDMVARTCVHNIQVCVACIPSDACIPMPAACPNACRSTADTVGSAARHPRRLQSAVSSLPDVSGAAVEMKA